MNLLLIGLFFIFNQNDSIFSETTVEIKKVTKLLYEPDGFYRAIETTYSTNGKFVVYDRGNMKIHIFDSNGKHLLEFGKSGQGPGELQTSSHDLTATNDKIYLFHFDHVSVFDFNGKHVKDHKFLEKSVSKKTVKNNHLIVTHPSVSTTEYSSFVFSTDGLSYLKQKNQNYDPLANLPEESDKLEQSYKQPYGEIPFNNTLIQWFQGEYKLHVLNETRVFRQRIKNDFDRVKMNAPPRWLQQLKKQANGNKKQLAFAENYLKKYQAVTGMYKNDIINVYAVNDHLIVQTQTESTKMIAFHVYNSELELVETKEINLPTTYTSLSFKSNYLIVDLVDEEIGPYAQIYSFNIVSSN